MGPQIDLRMYYGLVLRTTRGEALILGNPTCEESFQLTALLISCSRGACDPLAAGGYSSCDAALIMQQAAINLHFSFGGDYFENFQEVFEKHRDQFNSWSLGSHGQSSTATSLTRNQ